MLFQIFNKSGAGGGGTDHDDGTLEFAQWLMAKI